MRWILLTLAITVPQVGCAQQTDRRAVVDTDVGETLELTLNDVESAVARIEISQGPDSLGVTRSVWGPALYKKTVSSSIPILIYEKGTDGKTKITSSGSGALVSADGLAVTNWHVTGAHEYVLALLYPGKGQTYRSLQEEGVWIARVIKTDQSRDLSLLRLERPLNGPVKNHQAWNFLVLEDPNLIEVGQDVFSIGHPAGLHWTYTEGVISQIRPDYLWEMENGRFQATIIQTQTAVSFGSSGGPVINRNGKLVGIISWGLTERAGFNFAISAHELKKFLALPLRSNPPAGTPPSPVKPPAFGGSGG